MLHLQSVHSLLEFTALSLTCFSRRCIYWGGRLAASNFVVRDNVKLIFGIGIERGYHMVLVQNSANLGIILIRKLWLVLDHVVGYVLLLIRLVRPGQPDGSCSHVRHPDFGWRLWQC